MSAKTNGHDQDQVILIGNRQISRYIGISEWTVWNWRKRHSFPAASLPDGRVATTPSLIDAWILARSGSETRNSVDKPVDNFVDKSSHQVSD